MTTADFARALEQARQQGGTALQALAESHLPLVGLALRRYPDTGQDREELYQQGVIGLMKALRGYDPSRGTAFSTYAVTMILGEMRMLRRMDAPVHIPQRDAALHRQIRQTQELLTARLHREPTITDLAKELNMDAAELTLHMDVQMTSTDAMTESGTPLGDLLPDPEDWQTRIELRDVLSRLPEMDQRLILLRHRMGLTQTEAGQRLGMTQMQVSRREQIIRTLLRRSLAD